MATINGKPSLFITPVPPIENIPVYSERVANFTNIAESMVTEGEVNPNQAEQDWLNDPETQQEYQDYLDDIEAQRDRDAELETAEHEAYEAHLEAQAEAHDLENLGEAYLIGANTNHDDVWQQGGQV